MRDPKKHYIATTSSTASHALAMAMRVWHLREKRSISCSEIQRLVEIIGFASKKLISACEDYEYVMAKMDAEKKGIGDNQ
jgi:hypothetical protein